MAKKGYWIVHADVSDPEGYKAYVAADMAAIGKHGGRFLVRGGGFDLCGGTGPPAPEGARPTPKYPAPAVIAAAGVMIRF